MALGASAAFDLRALRDEHVKDRTGATLPATVDHGQFRWSIIDARPGARLVGRVALVSRVNGITSSYSCQVCCPDGYGSGVINPGSFGAPLGGSYGAGVYEDLVDCYGGDAGWVARYASSWSVQYPSVTSVQTTGTGTMQANGLSDGTSAFDGNWDTVYYEADPYTHECYQYGAVADAPGNEETLTPTYVTIIGTPAYTQGPPAPYVYNVNRQILDQHTHPLNGVRFVHEYFDPDPPSGNCTSAPVDKHDANSDAYGIFGPDLYSLPGTAPNPCTSTSTQHLQVDGRNVTPLYSVTWQFSGVTVTAQ